MKPLRLGKHPGSTALPPHVSWHALRFRGRPQAVRRTHCARLLQVFAVIRNPPWRKGRPASSGEGIPARTVHFQVDEHDPPRLGMVRIYCDPPWHAFWSDLATAWDAAADAPQLHAQVDVGERLQAALACILAEMMHKDNPLEVVHWGVRDWSRPPIGAAVHMWRPRFSPLAIMEKLAVRMGPQLPPVGGGADTRQAAKLNPPFHCKTAVSSRGFRSEAKVPIRYTSAGKRTPSDRGFWKAP